MYLNFWGALIKLLLKCPSAILEAILFILELLFLILLCFKVVIWKKATLFMIWYLLDRDLIVERALLAVVIVALGGF